MPAIVSLLDARSDWSAKRYEFRSAVRTHIARTLVLCSPHLDAELAGDIAVVLLNVMKTMARMTRESGGEVGPGAMTELREMTRLYLEGRLAVGAQAEADAPRNLPMASWNGGNPFPPCGERWPEGPKEGDRAERSGSERATRGAIARRSAGLCDVQNKSLVDVGRARRNMSARARA